MLTLLLVASQTVKAQVDVAATAGTAAASYTTLKAAADAINAGTHQGVITIGISADTTEAAVAAASSVVFNASGSGAAIYTSVTISPSGGAARTISGAATAGFALIDFNGADNITIDGLNTGGNSLTIANTTVTATSATSTIRFIGGATNNTITNSNIQGSGTMPVATNGATIFFSTDSVTANGNDNNTISNNNIGPAGSNLPTKGILGNGSTATTAIGNSGNIISNNNIFDFFGAAATSAGVATNGGCNTWTITNNRFYQTGTRTWTTGALHNAINVAGSAATSGAQGFTITGNTIGFASNTQTGTYNLTGSNGKFIGIVFNGITGATVSNVNNNTVASVSLTGVTSSGTSTSSPLTGILITNGLANTNNNTIGSQISTGSLTLSTTTTTATDVYGIYNFSVDNWTATSNTIGGISATNLGASGTFLIYGMRANTGTGVAFNASNNNVGGNVANSIQLTSTGAASQVFGMQTANALANWASNNIRNLVNNNGTGTNAAASVIGMLINSGTPVHAVSQNTISALSNTNATASTTVTGIHFGAGAAGSVVARNFIYGLNNASTATAAELNGIKVGGGTTVYRNNMIALGAGVNNAFGTAATNSNTSGISGINEFLGTNSFFHNSVYIDGSPTSGIGSSYAFNGNQTVNTRSFRDNIFFNARSNSGATGKNYAIKINGTTPNPGGLTINNNLYFANGAGAVFGFFNSLDVANIAAWKVAVGQDAASFESNPQFNDPTNPVPDLHLHPTNATVAEGNGSDVGVTDDFDAQVRAGLTPVDIGADAGNFVGLDLAPPQITFTAFNNTSSVANRTLTASITDNTGVATGGLAPRIYYRKNAGAFFSQACTLTSGTVQNGTWSCVVNTADVGGVVVADVISYFVIAQDTLANVGSTPNGVVAADVNTITSPPAVLSSYTIVAAVSGTLNVGPLETITSLTNAGGIFEQINNSVVTGNLVINITGDLLLETGVVALNQWVEEGAGGYTVLIKPSGGPRSIVGTINGVLIRFNGADRVTIDGSTTGATASGQVGGDAGLRELTIQNTNVGTSSGVISIGSGTNGAQNNTLRNLNVLGQDPTTTLLGIAMGGNTPGTAGTDNDNNRIENCSVRRAVFGVYSAGQNASNPNTGTILTMNDLSAIGADRIRRVGMLVFNDNGAQVTLNNVGNIDTNESADGIGIGIGIQGVDNANVTAGGVTNALVSRNRINGVNSQSATGFSAAGIAVAGSPGGVNTIANNMISGVTAPATSPDLVAGIYVAGVVGSSTRVLYNSIAMSGDRGVVASQMPSYGIAITGVDPTVELKNNSFSTTQTSGGGVNAKSYAIGMASTTFANLDSNYNNFFASGANAGFFRSGSLNAGAGTDYPTVAAWGTAIADDANSIQADPLYTSNTDLHLLAGSPLLNVGTPIAGVTVDFDGETRDTLKPEIGADEGPNTAPSITPTAGGISRQAGTPASNSTIAVVSDLETAVGDLVVTAQTVPAGLTVNTILNTAGTVTANVTASCTATVGANIVVLRATDTAGLFTDGNLTVNVSANTAPTIGGYSNVILIAGSGTTVTPSAAPGDNVAVSTVVATASVGFTGTLSVDSGTGVVTIGNAGPASVTPYVVTVTATDNCGATSIATFNLTVNAPNAAPTITPAVGLTRQAGSPASNGVIATVTDDAGAGTVVVTSSGPANGFTLSNIVNTNGTITADLVATCSATNSIFTLTATDTGTLTATGDIFPTVIANTPPTLGTYGATSVNSGAGTTVTPSVPPADNGTVSTIVASAPLFTGTLSVNPATGVVTIGNAGPPGVYTITVTATDNCGSAAQATFQLTVSVPNTAPTITATPVSKRQGDAASNMGIATVNDVEDAENTLVVTVNGSTAATVNGITVNSISVSGTGAVTANVVASCAATNAGFTLRVTDAGTLFNESTLNVTALPNQAPTLGYAPFALLTGTAGTVNPATGLSDSGISVSAALLNAGTYTGTIGVSSAGVISLSNAAPVGAHTITVQATDNCGLTSNASLSLTVLGDPLFSNGFEDLIRSPELVVLSKAAFGQVETLSLPVSDLLAVGRENKGVDLIEFDIDGSRHLLQVRGNENTIEVRLTSLGVARQVGEQMQAEQPWIGLRDVRSLRMAWTTILVEGELQVQAQLQTAK